MPMTLQPEDCGAGLDGGAAGFRSLAQLFPSQLMAVA
jgi:hypothetical protein